MNKLMQPAVKSYWFEKGWRDLRETIETAWEMNLSKVAEIRASPSAESDWGAVAKTVFNWAGILSIFLFGTLVTGIAALVNAVVVIVLMATVYTGFTVIWLADRSYLARNRIFTACHQCKMKSLIPTYLCPRCGAEHTRLVPGAYGILRRRCTGHSGTCGEILPTAFFNGRRHLVAQCEHCGTELNSRESRPICIPVVGGRSVGKTAFITAFSHDFINSLAPKKSLETELYNTEKGSIYREIERAYQTSDFELTPVKSATGISSVSFSFFVKNPNLKPDRLFHIYDIAGEVFTQNVEAEVQQQYEYCHGIVLIVDPLAIDSIYYRYEPQLSEIDKSRRGAADTTTVVDAFVNKLREVTGLSNKKIHSVPLAVVVTKIDAIEDLQDRLSSESARTLLASEPERFKTIEDAHDYQCRQLFIEHDMRHFISTINLRFKTNRFFACSPIGHTATQGAFRPEGVMSVMEWLVHLADPQLGQRMSETKFTKQPIGRKVLT